MKNVRVASVQMESAAGDVHVNCGVSERSAWQSVAESLATERRHDGHEATGTTPHIAVN